MSERKSILLVEDDDVASELMTLALTRHGYDVITAGDGIAGYDLARQHRPDLIITDVYMPAADGIHLVRRVRDDSEIAGTPIIVTTGAGTGTGIFSLSHGADAYERKPLDLHAFLDTVARLISPEDGKAATE
jgi:DNA-binding response OmpR family regulator